MHGLAQVCADLRSHRRRDVRRSWRTPWQKLKHTHMDIALVDGSVRPCVYGYVTIGGGCREETTASIVDLGSSPIPVRVRNGFAVATPRSTT
jgi:hypothetical protein